MQVKFHVRIGQLMLQALFKVTKTPKMSLSLYILLQILPSKLLKSFGALLISFI